MSTARSGRPGLRRRVSVPSPRSGARIAFATAQPASLLGVHAALARLARAAGGTIDDAEDTGPLRVDGRTGRFLRWIDGVAVVTDGSSLLATSGADAAEEWMFLVGRPSLVVADGPFAAAAVDAGVEVVAFAGLDRVDLAIPAVRSRALQNNGCLVVPAHSGRAPPRVRPTRRVARTCVRGRCRRRRPRALSHTGIARHARQLHPQRHMVTVPAGGVGSLRGAGAE